MRSVRNSWRELEARRDFGELVEIADPDEGVGKFLFEMGLIPLAHEIDLGWPRRRSWSKAVASAG